MTRTGRATRLHVFAVGRVRPPFADAVADYEARVDRRLGLRVDEVAAEPLQRGEARARAQEAERMRARLTRGAHVVALDPTGKQPAGSEAFARWLGAHVDAGRVPTFLIGGASGLDESLVGECAERMGLGPLTMPHQLARLVLTEQLYRAVTILDGHPYAH